MSNNQPLLRNNTPPKTNVYQFDTQQNNNEYPSLDLPDVSPESIKKEYKYHVLSAFGDNVSSTNYRSSNSASGYLSNTSAVGSKDEETVDLIPSSVDKENFDKISTAILIFYSLPSFGKMSCLILLNVNATLYYESIGASLIYMSFFVTLSRGIEILLKPFIAHLSDELRSKEGRRKPFMIAGCGFYALFLVLLFTPPSMTSGSQKISIWFGVFYVLFFLSESVTIVPYLALGPELSSNSKQREKLYFFFYVFQYIGVLFAAASPIVLNKFVFNSCDCSICLNNPLITDVDLCLRKCQIICGVKSNEDSLFSLSMLIGVFFVFSIGLLSFKIKEKSDSFVNDSMDFIPSCYELINNKPFLSLIPPWVLDVTIVTIFSTMLPFFLNIIINPQQYCIENNINLENIECSVNYHLGLTISIFFICCIAFCGLWHYLVTVYGKRKCWQMYSLIAIIPFSLFFFCDVGSFKTLILAAILTAFPTGGAYLNDVLVSDTIDYDEFYTGKRNEGIFTVCNAFIPKFVSIFAQALPLSLLAIVGFVPTDNGTVSAQPERVKLFIRLFFSAIPIVVAVVSFLFKLRYPIHNDGVMYQVKQGIDLQKELYDKLKAADYNYYKIHDPVYKRSHVNLIIRNENERITKKLADHFNNMEHLSMIFNGQYVRLARRMLGIIIIGILLFLFSLITVLYTFRFLSEQKFSFIPITGLFLVSFSIILIVLYILKYKEIKKVVDGETIVDNRLLRLIIFQKQRNDRHCRFKRDYKIN